MPEVLISDNVSGFKIQNHTGRRGIVIKKTVGAAPPPENALITQSEEILITQSGETLISNP